MIYLLENRLLVFCLFVGLLLLLFFYPFVLAVSKCAVDRQSIRGTARGSPDLTLSHPGHQVFCMLTPRSVLLQSCKSCY